MKPTADEKPPLINFNHKDEIQDAYITYCRF